MVGQMVTHLTVQVYYNISSFLMAYPKLMIQLKPDNLRNELSTYDCAQFRMVGYGLHLRCDAWLYSSRLIFLDKADFEMILRIWQYETVPFLF